MAMKIAPLSDALGAEVTGIDLRKPVSAADQVAMDDAFAEHLVLVVRDQDLTPAEYVAATKLFGEPTHQYFSDMIMEGQPEIIVLDSRDAPILPNGEPRLVGSGAWHTDHTNHEGPPKCTSLYAMVLPDEGGDTGIVNMRAGYAALPDEIKTRINDMQTLNVIEGSASPRPTSKLPTENKGKVDKGMLQPLVRSHPDCGDDALYFHPVKTEHVVGMSPEDSQVLLNELLNLTVKDEFIYRHKWRLGDMLIWDNRCSLHQAYQDYDLSQERLLHRVILKGERPFGPAMPLAS